MECNTMWSRKSNDLTKCLLKKQSPDEMIFHMKKVILPTSLQMIYANPALAHPYKDIVICLANLHQAAMFLPPQNEQ